MKMPRWTVLYNMTNPRSDFIGTAWEFFSDKATAYERYEELQTTWYCATIRPFHKETDLKHMGAVHRM